MVLTAENYYSREANEEYMSVSQYKDFAGTYGKMACEFTAMEKLNERWEDEKTTALLVGSYVDSYFEGTLDKFREENPEITKITKSNKNDLIYNAAIIARKINPRIKKGTPKYDEWIKKLEKDDEVQFIMERLKYLKSDFVKAEKIISRIKRDNYFMKYMSGEKQAIMTGELFGAKWKIKIDSYIPDVAIVDLKVMSSITRLEWVRDIGYLDFVRYWGYDIQGAVYQEIVRQNTGKRLPFFIAAATKETEPDIRIIHVTDNYLAEALNMVQMNMSRVLMVKSGKAEPDRCELCDCCRKNRVLTRPISITDLTADI